MQIRVLGPLEASIDDQPVAIGGAKQRAVLAMLGLEANRAVTADRLIEGLWGDEPPASAAKMVQNYVWRLRSVLSAEGGAEIVTRGRAYELRIDRELVDVCRLERLVSEASRAAAAGRPASAAREALALFRGDPLADSPTQPFADPEIRRLEELRLAAAELAIEADLAPGHHHELVGEIEALVAENPLRERLHAQRMLALYRCGRQAEALEAYRHARTTLVEEIGVEPSAELRQPARGDPAPGPVAGRRGRRRRAPARARRDRVAAADRPRRRAAPAAGPLAARGGGLGRAGHARRRVRHGQDPAGGRARRRGAPRRRHRALHGRDGPARGRAGRPRARPRDAAARADRGRRRRPRAGRGAGRAAHARARARPRPGPGARHRDCRRRRSRGSNRASRSCSSRSTPTASGRSPASTRRADEGRAIPVETLLATQPAGSRAASTRRRASGRGARRRAASTPSPDRTAAGRSEARALEAELAGSVVELQSARERAGLVARARRRRPGADGLPVQGPRDVRGRRRRVLLRARAARRRAGRAPRRRAAARDRRPVGQREVVGHESRAAARARRRRAAGQREVDAGGDPSRRAAAARAAPRDPPPLARMAPRAGGRPVRGAVHRLPGRGRARRVRQLARPRRPRRDRRLARCARGLLRPLRRLSRAVADCSAPTTCSSARCRATNWAARSSDPAQRVGLLVEPELVESLLGDVEGEPGALPLLSTALLELWRERDGRRLRLAAYARSGGVHGAVARLAEEAFVGLEPERQAIARKLLVRLADEDESGAVVRRRIALAELGGERGGSPRSSSGSPSAACSRSPTAPSRSRMRRSCANGRGCAHGWPRTPRGGACIAGSATPRARGTRTRATRAGSTAARAWPPRSTGRPATTPSSARPSARSSTTAGARAGVPSAGCG